MVLTFLELVESSGCVGTFKGADGLRVLYPFEVVIDCLRGFEMRCGCLML